MAGDSPALSRGASRGSPDLPEANSLTNVLACPRCRRGQLVLERAGWLCSACSSGYPVIGDIPWLFPEPRLALADWRARLSLLGQHLESEAAAMRAGVATGGAVPATRR